MDKKTIKKLWKEKAQDKYHIGCVVKKDTPSGAIDRKCYLSKVKKNGEYEFVVDHTYAKDFSEKKADELLKKLQDEFGGKIKNESLEGKLNESMNRDLFWSNSMTYDWFRDEATDDEILEYLEEVGLGLDDFIEYDEDDNPIEDSYDYDAIRDWLCKSEYVTWNDQDWEDLQYNIIPELESQIKKDLLIIDGEKINPGAWRSNAGREKYHYWFDPICEKIQDYYGNAEIYLDEDGNLEGWYTIPSNDAGLYRLARNIPEVAEAVKEELEFREEYQDDEDFDGGSYPGVNGKDLWLAVLEDTDLSEVDFDGLERFLVPIKKPW